MSRRHGPPARVAKTAGAAAITAAAAAVLARAGYATLRRRPPGGAAVWARTNHRGEAVTLLEGPAAALGAALASALAPGLAPRGRAALVAAGAGAAAFGGYDDLAGSGDRRGFRGHLGALARGEVTTGAVKIGGIGAAGVVAAVLAGGSPADVVINAGLTAGGANLLNLFDLRQGRAIKVALAGAALLAGTGPAAAGAVAAPAGAALALLPEDLGERAMLGDAGANALGAVLGAAAAAGLSRPARLAVLTGIMGLTAASEVISFTAVIQRTPALRWLDMLGRRPPAAGPAGAGQPTEGAGQPAEGAARAQATPAAGAAAADGAAAAGPAVNGRRRTPATRRVQGAGPTPGAFSP
jgi:UDP-GlcNAc:undecaprenyl-phosphate/decaprenyl-phosphate GlcNAc-1-phosphate transferase